MSDYDPSIAAQILELIAEDGVGLSGACKRLDIPRRRVRNWAARMPEFREALALARRAGYEHWADEILEIGDQLTPESSMPEVQAARVKIDSRKWLLSKLHPEQYGDKVELTGAGGQNLFAPEAQIPRLMAILAVLLPGSANSELYRLATTMSGKLRELEPPKQPEGANGHGEGNGHDEN